MIAAGQNDIPSSVGERVAPTPSRVAKKGCYTYSIRGGNNPVNPENRVQTWSVENRMTIELYRSGVERAKGVRWRLGVHGGAIWREEEGRASTTAVRAYRSVYYSYVEINDLLCSAWGMSSANKYISHLHSASMPLYDRVDIPLCLRLLFFYERLNILRPSPRIQVAPRPLSQPYPRHRQWIYVFLFSPD